MNNKSMMIKHFNMNMNKKFCFFMMFIFTLLLSKDETTMSSIIGTNMISSSLVILCFSLFLISSSEKFSYTKKSEKKMFFMLKITLFSMCILSFCSEDKLMFFVSFEVSIIPMLVMVFFMGKSKEKVESSLYMMIMSMSGSVPFLIYLTKENFLLNSLIMEISMMEQKKISESLLMVSMFMVMLIKIPMFLFHVWLPKAHVEASTLGSMILAGIMLKLGISGLFKNIDVLSEKLSSMKTIIMMISWVSTLTCMVMSIRSSDIKKMAAISSITHMGMTLSSIVSMKVNGMIGGMVMTVTHGLVSSTMFLLIGSMYEKSSSRSIFTNKNMESLDKQLSMLWLMTMFMNVGIPPMGSFLSEVYMMMTFFCLNKYVIIFILCSMFMTSAVSMIFVTKSIFSKVEKMNNIFKPMPIPIFNFILCLTFLNLTAICSI